MALGGVRLRAVRRCGMAGSRFKLSDADYRQLAGEDLSAIVTVDRGSGHILGVRLL
jgi:hypothetical protein